MIFQDTPLDIQRLIMALSASFKSVHGHSRLKGERDQGNASPGVTPGGLRHPHVDRWTSKDERNSLTCTPVI